MSAQPSLPVSTLRWKRLAPYRESLKKAIRNYGPAAILIFLFVCTFVSASFSETPKSQSIAAESQVSGSGKPSIICFEARIPIAKLVEELNRAIPSEESYGLQGASVGRNGLREEVPNGDVIKNGRKVDELRFKFFDDSFAWAEKGGTFGPPGFQYYIYRHPISFDYAESGSFILNTRLDFKAAVAVNYDTGFLGIKPWIFADCGFGSQWPRTVAIGIKSNIRPSASGFGFESHTTCVLNAETAIVMHTLHGVVQRDCTPEFLAHLQKLGDKLAGEFDSKVSELSFESEVNRFASSLQQSFPIGNDFRLRLAPSKLLLGQELGFDKASSEIVVMCGMETELLVTDDEPAVRSNMPELQVVPNEELSHGFSLSTRVSVSADTIEESLAKSLANNKLVVSENLTVKFGDEFDIEFPESASLELKVGHLRVSAGGQQFAGSCVLRSRPTVSRRGGEWLVDPNFELKSIAGKNMSDRLKSLLMEAELAKRLSTIAELDISKALTPAISSLETQHRLDRDTRLVLSDLEVLPTGVKFAPGKLNADFEIRGKAKIIK